MSHLLKALERIIYKHIASFMENGLHDFTKMVS